MRKAEKEKKNLVSNSVLSRPVLENSKNNSKKIRNIKKLHFGIISIQTGMRQAKKENKNFSPEFRSYPAWVTKFQKKLQKFNKQNSGIISIQTRLRQAEKEKKKNLVPNSVPIRPGHEYSKKKKNSKKIQKIKKHHSGIISIQTGMRQAEKEKKIF